MTPTLSGVRAYDPAYLRQAAAHWRSLAGAWTSTWSAANHNLLGSGWHGVGAQSALDAHAADWVAANGHADSLTQAAEAAERGYEELTAMRDGLLDQVRQIQQQGYEVSDAFVVSPGSGPAAHAGSRQAAAGGATDRPATGAGRATVGPRRDGGRPAHGADCRVRDRI